MNNRLTLLISVCAVFACLLPGCRRDAPEPPAAPAEDPASAAAAPVDLVFPDELRAKDPAINEFVGRAMRTASQGDYDSFRALWSATQEPPPREKIIQGSGAVKAVRVRALERVMVAPEENSDSAAPREVYAVYVEIELDPAHPAAVNEQPLQKGVMIIMEEQGNWTLARAPRSVIEWLSKKVAAEDEPTPLPADPTRSAP